MNIRKIAAVILVLLGVAMIYLGVSLRILPPALTGIGFLAISAVFFTTRN
jgi:hypothetical protein